VVIAGEGVDDAATAALRQRMREARNWAEAPVYSWGTALAAQ
jgi:hypothetical protein